jgi:MFS transporter, DHA2 family, methylenomycin A resistance protein
MSDGKGRAWTLLATSLGFAVVQLDVSVVNVAIKPIGAALGGGVSSLQWVVSAYTLAFAALILTAGALGDRVGAKRVFITGFLIFTAASAACGLAPSMGVLIASRVVQGVGAAVLGGSSLALLNHTYPRAGRAGTGCGAMGRWSERRTGRRPTGGRTADLNARVALDLLHQRPDRPARHCSDGAMG